MKGRRLILKLLRVIHDLGDDAEARIDAREWYIELLKAAARLGITKTEVEKQQQRKGNRL